MLARLFRYGRMNYRGCFVSLRNGRSAPILIDPYDWARMQSGRKENIVVFGSVSDV